MAERTWGRGPPRLKRRSAETAPQLRACLVAKGEHWRAVFDAPHHDRNPLRLKFVIAELPGGHYHGRKRRLISLADNRLKRGSWEQYRNMGLIGKIFGSDSKPAHGLSSKFAEGHSQTAGVHTKPRSAARRDLVKLALRDAMRKHGIPSDWMDCRTLSVASRDKQSGMHVQFMVRKADQQVLGHVHAFQESFWQEIEGIDPQARQWLFSVGWEFGGKADQSEGAGAQKVQPAAPTEDPQDDLASDLEALHALMTAPAELENSPDEATARRKPA
jgi:hypothetical protein